MTAKEYLQQIKSRRERIRILLEEIEQLRTDAESCSINLDGMPRNQSGSASRFENLAIQLTECESALTEEMSKLWRDIIEAHSLIGDISSSQRQRILTKRYINGQRWEEIAYEMHMSWQHCFRVHRLALAELDKIIETNKDVIE